MGKPINPRNFGQTGIQINFWNGSSVITGYIVKQTGTNRYNVSNDNGTVTDTVYLQLAAPSAAGQGQIPLALFGGGTAYASVVLTNLVRTFEDYELAWSLGGSPVDANHCTITQNS